MVLKTKKKAHTSRYKYVKKKSVNKKVKESNPKDKEPREYYSEEDLPHYNSSNEDYTVRNNELLLEMLKTDNDTDSEYENHAAYVMKTKKEQESDLHIDFVSIAVSFNIPMSLL